MAELVSKTSTVASRPRVPLPVNHIRSVDRRLGIQRGEISAPGDGHLRIGGSNRDGRRHLRPRHHGKTHQVTTAIADRPQRRTRGMLVHITVDPLVRMFLFQHLTIKATGANGDAVRVSSSPLAPG